MEAGGPHMGETAVVKGDCPTPVRVTVCDDAFVSVQGCGGVRLVSNQNLGERSNSEREIGRMAQRVHDVVVIKLVVNAPVHVEELEEVAWKD